MIPIVDASLQLATQALTYLNTLAARKYIDQVANLKQKILDEESKLDLANDAMVEHLEAELLIALEAAKNEIILEQSK